MPENLVSFPAPPRVAPAVAHACSVFLQRWDGVDVREGARQLTELLPEHVPGPLKLVVLRALRQLDVPPFPSAESFRAAVARFAAAQPELRTLSDVRRARRETRLRLEEVATRASLPIYMLRQLEWGDFRQWQNAEWSERVSRAYARVTGLDPDRVVAIVDEERRTQLVAVPAPIEAVAEPLEILPLHAPIAAAAAVDTPLRLPRRRARLRSFALAAAAAAMFGAGLGIGGAIVERYSALPAGAATLRMHVPQPPALPAPSAPPPFAPPAVATSGTDTIAKAAPPHTDAQPAVAEPSAQAPLPSTPAVPEPTLLSASAAGAPAFSPSFSNVGSALFYHRDEGVGTALVKADRDETTGDLRIINIVEDNARNYHVRPSPDGSHIAFDSDRDGERGVYVANGDGTAVRRVSGPGFAALPSWSPDGRLLAFVRAEHDQRTWNLWLLNLETSEMRRVTDYRYGQPWGASWFPDGRRVAYSHEDRLTVLDLPTGTKRIFKSPRAGRLVRTPAVSPDGRHIVFQVYNDGAWMLDLRDGSMQRILADPTAEEFAWDPSGHRLAFHSRRSGNWSVWIMAGPSS